MSNRFAFTILVLLTTALVTGLLASADNSAVILLLIIGAILFGYLCVRDPFYSLAFVIIAAPLYQYRFDLPLIPVHLTVHRLFLGVTVASLVFSLIRQRSGTSPDGNRKPDIILIFLLFWLVLELVATGRSNYTAGINRLFPRLVNMSTAFLVFIIVRDRRTLVIGVSALLISAVIPMAVGLWQVESWLLTGEFPGIPFQEFLESNLRVFSQAYKGSQATSIGGLAVPRFASVLVDTNYFGLFLSIICLVSVGVLDSTLIKTRLQRVGVQALVVLSVILMLLTLSRSSLIGLIVGWGIYFLFRQSFNLKNLFRLAVALGLVWLALSTLFTQFDLTPQQLVSSRFDSSQLNRSSDARAALLEPALDAFATNPLFGIGASNILSYGLADTSHTTPFTILAEYGLVGFISFYSFILALLWRLQQHWKRQHDAIALSLFAVLISLQLASLFYDHFLTLETNWVVMGLSLALIRVRMTEEPAPDHSPDHAQTLTSSRMFGSFNSHT